MSRQVLITTPRPQTKVRLSVAGFDLSAPVARWELPGQLREISGLAIVGPDRVLAHNDESGHLFELDYHRGAISREFQMGSPVVRGDFEGIEVVGNRVTLMTSDGRLFSAALPESGSVMDPITIDDTILGRYCEFEGLARGRDGAWLLPCKVPRRRARDRLLTVYRWSPTDTERPPLVVPLGEHTRALRASAITETAAGTFLVLCGADHLLGEFTTDGTPLALVALPAQAQRQPEGLTITPDGFLLIADESQGNQTGLLTVYGASR